MSLSDADMVEFREAQASDLVAIQRLDPRRGTGAEGASTLGSGSGSEIEISRRLIVGVFSREVVCCGRLTLSLRTSEPLGVSGVIDSVGVASSMTGRGIAEVVVDHLSTEARLAGADTIDVLAS